MFLFSFECPVVSETKERTILIPRHQLRLVDSFRPDHSSVVLNKKRTVTQHTYTHAYLYSHCLNSLVVAVILVHIA